ncbi:HD domain-containing protein [Byssothecium circinans]|uniref:5'-deoxynucleotidase n=1 Tax=Byssothecium circinans TaxID=147558 RepID=A0A6A5U750_9PLEO|nr:HD domain-containing protein [Byssothecium circinans]
MTSSNSTPPTNGASKPADDRPATADESTQTNGFSDPKAGKLSKEDVKGGKQWTVERVLDDISSRYDEDTDSPVSFIHLLERLKTTKRAGWQRFGIKDCESISDHMYRMSIITMMAPKDITDGLDILRCTRMALIHDMAESLVGDITPADNVVKEEKNRRESDTMDYICNKLLGKFNGGLNAQEIRALWQEYEDSVTKESLFVHDIDKLELIAQMVEYERHFKCTKDLGQFTYITLKIQTPAIKDWCSQFMRERQQLWAEHGVEPKWAENTKPTENS